MIGRFSDLAVALGSSRPGLGPVRFVAVDGRAGSGKTTFARRLARACRNTGMCVEEIHTDDLLPGWAQPLAFWPGLANQILVPLAANRPGAYAAYDWATGRFRTERIEVPVPDLLLVEGVASACQAARASLTRAFRVLTPRGTRLSRGIARDGEHLCSEWLRWMTAEDAHFADDPGAPSDLLIDGASDLPHDPDTEYVEAVGDRRRVE